MGCGLRSTSGPSERVEGAAEDFGVLGRKQLWAEKKKGKKGNSFSFSENIFVKRNNLEIAR
jgi:hypothetical protein